MALPPFEMRRMDDAAASSPLRCCLQSDPPATNTAKVQLHEVAGYIALGAAGVIPKPFDVIELPDEIQRIVSRAAPPNAQAGPTRRSECRDATPESTSCTSSP
jgi:hypothetical protein